MALVAARRANRVGAIGPVALLLAACTAQGPPPYAELSASARKVASAEVAVERGASADVAAARRKLEAAEAALAAGDNDRAWRLAVEAGLDAELAAAQARAAAAEGRLARHLAQRSDRSETMLPASFRDPAAR